MTEALASEGTAAGLPPASWPPLPPAPEGFCPPGQGKVWKLSYSSGITKLS